MKTVADRRLDDATVLLKNDRANGAMYLGVFVIECLLKARLLEKFPWLLNAGSPEGRTVEDKRIWSLCYRSHDLDEILARIPGARKTLSKKVGEEDANRLWQSLLSICAEWTIQARYSPRSARTNEAEDFLDQVKELKKWLD